MLDLHIGGLPHHVVGRYRTETSIAIKCRDALRPFRRTGYRRSCRGRAHGGRRLPRPGICIPRIR
jgi:hypothetical protein